MCMHTGEKVENVRSHSVIPLSEVAKNVRCSSNDNTSRVNQVSSVGTTQGNGEWWQQTGGRQESSDILCTCAQSTDRKQDLAGH